MRILDVYLCGSDTFVFRVALAVFAVNENRLLECRDLEEVLHVLQRRDYGREQLLRAASCLFVSSSDDSVRAELREQTGRAMRAAGAEGEARTLRWATLHLPLLGPERAAHLLASFRSALDGPAAAAGLLDKNRAQTLLLEQGFFFFFFFCFCLKMKMII